MKQDVQVKQVAQAAKAASGRSVVNHDDPVASPARPAVARSPVNEKKTDKAMDGRLAPLQQQSAPLRNKIIMALRSAIELGLLQPGPRLVESAEILAEILHPDAALFGHRGKTVVRHQPAA